MSRVMRKILAIEKNSWKNLWKVQNSFSIACNVLREKITNKSLNIKYGAIEYKEREIMIPWEEGRQLPNWSPKLSLEEGIKKFLGY